MALSAAERQRKRYHENPLYRERKIAQVKAYAKRHGARLRANRMTPEFRAKRAQYMRVWVLANKVFEDWRFSTWARRRRRQEEAA